MHRLRSGRLLWLFLLALLAPIDAWAAGDFRPTLLDTSGELEIGMTRSDHENYSGGNGLKTSERSLHERLRLTATGFIYHPRFILFKVQGAERLEQQTFDRNYGGRTHTDRSFEEYEARATVLPEHPYNLELFAVRMRPVTRNRFAADIRSETDERGAVLRYGKKPLFLDAGVTDISTTGSSSSTETRTYRASGSAALGPTANAVGCSRTATSGIQNSSAVRESCSFSNHLTLHPLSLATRVEESEDRQGSSLLPAMTQEAFSWSELLQADLPGNVHATASYGVLKTDVTTAPAGTSGGSRSWTTATTSGVTASHRLYESLASEAGYSRATMESSGGNTDITSRRLSESYAKRIPTGRLTVGISLASTVSRKAGTLQVLREEHAAQITESFDLAVSGADAASVSLSVKDPGTGVLVPLVRDVHYAVQQTGLLLRIYVLTLPSPFEQGIAYVFSVTYAITTADIELETDTATYSTSVSVLDGLVGMSFSHTVLSQELHEGVMPGMPDAGATDRASLVLQADGASFSTEHSTTRSRTSPSDTWRSQVAFRGAPLPDWDASGSLSYDRNDFRATTGPAGNSDATEKITSGMLTVQKRLIRFNLNVSGGFTYSRRRSFIDADTSALNAVLRWNIGRLTVSAGASANRTVTEAPAGRQTAASEYYHLTITRKLF